jgi:hypothetical protein
LGDDRSGALRLLEEFEEVALEPETQVLSDRLHNGRAWRLPSEALSRKSSVTWRRAPLLERKRELETALAQWREVRRGPRLALLVVTADAGGGKSRFLEELVARATLDGATICATRAVPADLEERGSTLIGLARGGLADAPGVAGANPAALATLAAQVGEWAERFPQRDKSTSTWNLGAALVEVLRVASAERPAVLIFDDAQWIDPASYQFLEQLTRDLPRARLLIVLATTPEPAPPKLAELRARIGRDIAGAAVSLDTFTLAAIGELIRWALPSYAGETADRLARRIAADSGGVPLLAVEMCQAMARGLDIESLSGSWPHPLRTLDSTFPGDLPDTIVAAIRVESRCLTRPAQQALVATAIIGERVSSREIAAATGLAGESLHAALDELEWRRWLVAESRGYAFVARIVRDVIARDMVKQGERQRILDAAKAAS